MHWRFLSTLTSLLVLTAASADAGIIHGDAADAERRGNGSLATSSGTLLRAGTFPGGSAASLRSNALFVFDLSSLPADVTDLDLSIFYDGKIGGPGFNVDLYGVGFGASATSFPSTADFNQAATDGNATLIQDNFVTSSTTQGASLSTDATGDSALLAYLNSRPAGMDFVFLRLSPDATLGNGNHGYMFRSADYAGTDSDPALSYTIANPEPASITLLGIGTLGLAGCVWRRRKTQVAS